MRPRQPVQLWEMRRGKSERLTYVLVPIEGNRFEVLVSNVKGNAVDSEACRTLEQALGFAAHMATQLTVLGWRDAKGSNGRHVVKQTD